MGIGYRLRVIRLVPQGASSYGSNQYGDGTYGQRATDTADLQRYEIVPRVVSAAEMPFVTRRALDSGPLFECWIMAFATEYEGVERSGVKLDLTGVVFAHMLLFPLSSQPGFGSGSFGTQMQVVPPYLLSRELTGAFPVEGTFRLTITLTFDTGRRLTLPVDDSLVLVFTGTRPTVVNA